MVIYIPHEISDLLFYEHLDVKPEIVTIDNIKYEKVQYVNAPSKDKYDDWSGTDITVEYFFNIGFNVMWRNPWA